MSFKREGDDGSQLNVLKKRRVADLLASFIPEDEAILLKNGRYACTVCFHRPVFDTLDMLTVHRRGKKHVAKDAGSPGEMPDDMDDELGTISQQTLHDVLGNPLTPPSVTRRSTEIAAIIEDPPITPIVQPASSNPDVDSEDTGTSFERSVVGVQRELAREVRVGMQSMAASLEGVRSCMWPKAEQAAAMQGLTTALQEHNQSVKDISTAVRELTQHLQQHSSQRVHECNIDPLRADLAAYHTNVAAILKNQQLLLAAVMPCIVPQLAATRIPDSTSSNTEVCVASSNPPPPRAEETAHTSEEEDVEQITFTHKSTQ